MRCYQSTPIKARLRFEELDEASFVFTKGKSGRRFARYWDDVAGKWCTITRAKWRWEAANGSVPRGLMLHHKNEIPSDDRLDNLELMTRGDHQRHHHSLHGVNTPAWVCSVCGRDYRRQNSARDVYKYCSLACRNEGQRKSPPLTCERCGASFRRSPSEITKAKARGAKHVFCSRACVVGPKPLGRMGQELPP
jgi:hypothetical protein